MAIAFKASFASGSTNTSTSASATLILADASNAAYSLQEGDFCIMMWAASDDNSRVSAFQARRTLDGTWTALVTEGYAVDGGSPDNNVTTGMYYKVQGSTPDTTMPIPNVSGTNMAVSFGMLVFSGVDTGVIIDAHTPATGTNTGRPNPGAATPLSVGAWPVVFCAASNGSSTGAAFIQGGDLSTTTNHFRTTNTNGSSKDCTFGFGIKTNWVSGSFDPLGWTGSTTDSDSCWSSHHITLVAAKPVISPSTTNFNQVENSAFSQTFTADMAVTWSIVGGTDSGKFTMGSGTGVLGMVAKDYESPDDANADRVYGVTIRADAGGGLYTDKAVTCTITNQAAPSITPSTAAWTIDGGNAFSADYAPNTATWTISGGADAALFSITSPAGVLSMTSKDYMNPLDANGDNVYEVTIRAANVEGFTDKAITVTVGPNVYKPTANSQDTSGTATGSWSNLLLCYADDNTYGQHSNIGLNQYTDIATLSGFDLSSIPDSATIKGIEVVTEINGTSSSGTQTHQMEFSIKTSPYKVTGYIFGRDLAANQVITLGGPLDTWGLTGADLTGSGLKSGFNVNFLGRGNTSGTGNGTLQVDYAWVKIYYDPTVSLTSTNLTTSSASVSLATVGQLHNLNITELTTSVPSVTSSAIGQKHVMSAQTVATSAPSITTATIGQKHIMSAQTVATPVPSITSATLTRISILTTTNLVTSAPSISLSVLTRITTLTSQNIATPAPSITTATIGQKHIMSAQTVATPTPAIALSSIGQKHNLASVGLASPTPVISLATLVRKVVLATQDLALPAPIITQSSLTPTIQKIIRPVSTGTAGGWTDHLDGTNLAPQLDEVVPDDGDYIKSSDNPTNDICRLKLATLNAVSIHGFVKLRYRLKRHGDNVSVTQTVRLYSGGTGTIGSGTLIDSWTHNVTDFTTFEQSIDASLIPPANDLWVELEAA